MNNIPFRNEWDSSIFSSVVEDNEYKLPEDMDGYAVVDIGSHIGSFAIACLERGAKKVICFEPDVDNFEILKKGLKEYCENRYKIYNCGVWKSGSLGQMMVYSGYDENTGSGNVVFGGPSKDNIVKVMGIDDVFDIVEFECGNDKIDIMKLDCEFSEYPILYSCESLNKVKKIVGEFHEIQGDYDDLPFPKIIKVKEFDDYTICGLRTFLKSRGFDVSFIRNPGSPQIGLFWADRN